MNIKDIVNSFYSLAVYLTGDSNVIKGQREALTAIVDHITSGAHLASQAQAEAGVENTKLMTALRTAQAIEALGGGGGSIATPFSFQTTAQCADATALIAQIMTATQIPTSYNAYISFAIKIGSGEHIHFVSRNGSFGDGENGSIINATTTFPTRSQQVAITYPIASGTTIVIYGMTFTPSVGG